MLIIVKHRDVQQVPQAGLDLEATRRGDVLEIDTAVDRCDALHDTHDLIDVLGRETDGPRVDVREPLEEQSLALHHGQRGLGSDIAQAQHRRTVRDDGHRIALYRELSRE